jgi:hypothetical protein
MQQDNPAGAESQPDLAPTLDLKRSEKTDLEPLPSSSTSPASPAETIRPASDTPKSSVQKALQAGINKDSFEQEVGQVLDTFSSWWGGVKKQVRLAPRLS